jgi:hypothetical protein
MSFTEVEPIKRVGQVVGLVVVALAAVLAARADAVRPQATVWFTTLDIVTGLMFVVGAAAAVGPVRQRWLMALVGVAWLAGSIAPVLSLLHQAAVLVGLTAFPAGASSLAGARQRRGRSYGRRGCLAADRRGVVFAVFAGVVGIHRLGTRDEDLSTVALSAAPGGPGARLDGGRSRLPVLVVAGGCMSGFSW